MCKHKYIDIGMNSKSNICSSIKKYEVLCVMHWFYKLSLLLYIFIYIMYIFIYEFDIFFDICWFVFCAAAAQQFIFLSS